MLFAVGKVASQVAIKMLGTKGGGFLQRDAGCHERLFLRMLPRRSCRILIKTTFLPKIVQRAKSVSRGRSL